MNYNWPQVVVPYRTAKVENLLSAEGASDTSLGFRFASLQADILLTLRVAIRLIFAPLGSAKRWKWFVRGGKDRQADSPNQQPPISPVFS